MDTREEPDPVRTMAAVGDAVAEMLGVACARNERGDVLDPAQIEPIRDAILAWHATRARAQRRSPRDYRSGVEQSGSSSGS